MALRRTLPVVTEHVCSQARPSEIYEYELDFYNFHGSNECLSVPQGDLAVQKTITAAVRAYEVDLLVALHGRIGYHTETLFEAVRLMDIFLARRDLHKDRLRLLTFSALLLGAKHEETQVPGLGWLAREGGRFRASDLRQMEASLFAHVGFHMGLSLAPHFFKRFLRIANADQTIVDTCYYLAEASLTNAALICELPSRVAAACTYLALCLVRGVESWRPDWDEEIGVPASEYRPLAQGVLDWLRSVPYREFCRHVVAKYSIEERSRASLRRLPVRVPM